jgi:hypothetical protein
MKTFKGLTFTLLVLLLALSTNGLAQDSPEAVEETAEQVEDSQITPTEFDKTGDAEAAVTNKDDKSGTNPINFQRDFRVYNEFLWLNTAGDGNQNLTTLEFRTPFAGGKWQFRTRVPVYNMVNADLNGDGMDDIDDGGIGDVNFRLMTVPWMKGANAFAAALEVFVDTASEDSLGAGTTSLAPIVFWGIFSRAVSGLGRRAVFLRRDCSTSSVLTRTRAAPKRSRP